MSTNHFLLYVAVFMVALPGGLLLRILVEHVDVRFYWWRRNRREAKRWAALTSAERNHERLIPMLKYTQRPGYALPKVRAYAMEQGLLEPEGDDA